MREIKFRAWDTSRKVMHSAYEMGQDQEALLPDGRGFANISSTSTKLTQIHSNLLPLQYTGLKDKNGKEIYEGDIVEASAWGSAGYNMVETFMIEFSNGAFRGFIIRYRKRKDRFSFSTPLYKLGNIEVIGNIYENPELLKATK